jgi:U-box domain
MPSIALSTGHQDHQDDVRRDDDDDCSVQTTPDEFVCPISLCVMKDPVVSKTGQNYDRQAILQWLNRGNDSCPLTRQPLKPSLLVPNHHLKRNILKWKMDRQVFDFDDDDDDQSADVGGWLNLPDRRPRQTPERSQSVDGLSDLLALYEEVMELIDAPPHHYGLSNDAAIVSDRLATSISSIDSFDDDEDMSEIRILHDEVLSGM